MVEIEVNALGKKKVELRNPWIYNREIKSIVGNPELGEVGILKSGEKLVAIGFVNTKSKIVFRVLDFNVDVDVGKVIRERIKNAVDRRKDLSNTNSLRLIHAEADGLPGLVVDKYGDNVICSFDSAGADRFKSEIVYAIKELVKPKGIYEKANAVRGKERLDVKNQVLYGQVDDEFIVFENGKRFKTYLKDSQKTGFYLDQRKNRQVVSNFCGERTLDLFAHSGAFGIYTNAKFTKFVEISKKTADLIKDNCKLNNVENFEIVNGDVFKFLESENNRYDLIVIDPPAFAKNRNSLSSAKRGLKYLLVNSLKLLEKGGYLAIFSCSHVVGYKELLDISLSSSIAIGISLEVVEFLKQDIDHPSLLNVPSSLYLTGLLLKKVN